MAAIPEDADKLSRHFERGPGCGRGHGSEILTDPGLVNPRIEHAVGQAQNELLIAQPGIPRSPCLPTIARDHTRVTTSKGAQFGTLVGPFQRAYGVDLGPHRHGVRPSTGSGPLGHGARRRTTRPQREFLRDTAAGIEQRITAQRLGIGPRTLSKGSSKCRELGTDVGPGEVDVPLGALSGTADRRRVVGDQGSRGPITP
ncbi:hypothetical protein GCM10010278_79890 [Streptomyces melanogenes]|nr:hypothetical protein GCM10010278_79890 [Streptomyces melanogenes]